MTGSLSPFVQRLVMSHWFHLGDWDLCFFPVSWGFFEVGLVIPDRCSLCATLFYLDGVQLSFLLMISPFLALSVLLAVLLFCLLFRWMRTAILAGGIAVVRSGFRSVSWFAKDGE